MYYIIENLWKTLVPFIFPLEMNLKVEFYLHSKFYNFTFQWTTALVFWLLGDVITTSDSHR